MLHVFEVLAEPRSRIVSIEHLVESNSDTVLLLSDHQFTGLCMYVRKQKKVMVTLEQPNDVNVQDQQYRCTVGYLNGRGSPVESVVTLNRKHRLVGKAPSNRIPVCPFLTLVSCSFRSVNIVTE